MLAGCLQFTPPATGTPGRGNRNKEEIMLAKLFNIALALLFAVLSSLTCLHGVATPQFKVVIASITLLFIMAELALYFILGKLVIGPSLTPESEAISPRDGVTEHEDARLSEMLSLLPPEWIVLKNFYRNGIDADFIVIGPSGIHVITVKDLRGTIENYDSFLLLNKTRSINDFIRGVKEKAGGLRRDFRSFATRGNVIKPVLYFSSAHLCNNVTGIHDGVLVTSAPSVIADITEEEIMLTSFDVYGIYTFLSQNSVYSKISTHSPFRGCYVPQEPEADENEKHPLAWIRPEGATGLRQ
jgi:Nuclease-related domain